MQNRSNTRRLAMAMIAGVCAAAGAQPVVTTTTVARTGQPAPDGGDITFGGLCGADPQINDNGTILMGITVGGTGVTFGNWGRLVAGGPGAWVNVARQTDPAPGAPNGLTYGSPSINSFAFPNAVLTANDEVVYSGYLLNGGWVTAFFAGPVGGPSYVAAQSFPAPGVTPSTNVSFLEVPLAASAQGLLVFEAGLSGQPGRHLFTADEFSAIRWYDSSLTALNRSLPGFPGNVFSFVDGLYANDQDRIAFVAALASPVATSQNSVICAGLPGQLTLVAQEGAIAPDLGMSTYSFDFRDTRLRIANDDVVAFSSPISGDTTGAIFLGGFTDVRLYAFDGMQAPGLPAGVQLASLGTTPIELNGQASVAFSARLTGPGVDATNDSAIFEGPPGDIRMLMREGDPLPGGGTLEDLYADPIRYNDRRQVLVFTGASTGQGVYVATSPAGQLGELARSGSVFITDDGFAGGLGAGVWTRGFARTTGSAESGRGSRINNLGEMVLELCFGGSTGSGVFMFTVEDPCPGDLVEPTGTLDFFDVLEYLALFDAMDPAADLAEPFGSFDFFDVLAYLGLFDAGC